MPSMPLPVPELENRPYRLELNTFMSHKLCLTCEIYLKPPYRRLMDRHAIWLIWPDLYLQDGKDFFEKLPEELLLKIMGQKTLSTKDRVRLMCVSRLWSTVGLEQWTRVDIDDVSAHQMPVVLKLINKLGLHDAGTLQHISFTYTAASQMRVPGKAQLYA